jgi:pyruvate dehydrogenase E2 component (dihydrolipoamide acetyltransferase)
MPRLSDTMEEGVLSQWVKHEGDQVRKGDVLAVIETDKAAMEMEAYDEGVLTKSWPPKAHRSRSPLPAKQPNRLPRHRRYPPLIRPNEQWWLPGTRTAHRGIARGTAACVPAGPQARPASAGSA